VGSIGAEGILDDDGFKTGMILLELGNPSLGRIALAVILGIAVLLADRFRGQRYDDHRVGIDYGGPDCLEIINCHSRLGACLHETEGGEELLGGKEASAIQRHEVVASHEDHLLKGLASLSIPK